MGPLDRLFHRLHRVSPERLRREEAMRAGLLARLLVGGAIALAVGAAVVAWPGGSASFWATAFMVLAGEIAISFVLLRIGRVHDASVMFLAITTHPACWAVYRNGADGPAPVLFLLSIVICGLLVGGWLLLTWTAIVSALFVVFAWLRTEAGLRAEWWPMPPTIIAWLAAFVATAFLVWLFARTLERLNATVRAEAETLARALAPASTESGPDAVLGRSLAATAEETGARRASVWELQAGGLALRRAAAHPASSEGAEVFVETIETWGRLMRGVPITLRGAERARVGALAAAGASAVHLVPLPAAGTAGGVLVLEADGPRAFDGLGHELSLALARLVALALRLANLARGDQAAALERDRQRIAREIHDGLAQGFTGVMMQLNAAEEALSRDPLLAAPHLARARELARESLQEARRSVWALRPVALERGRLSEALARLARDLVAGSTVRLSWSVEGAERTLPVGHETELLRIGQEALTNALRHAGAANIAVSLRYTPGEIVLEVRDDGVGAGPHRAASAESGGLGLAGMRERVVALSGRFAVSTQAGGGTSIEAALPLNGADA